MAKDKEQLRPRVALTAYYYVEASLDPKFPAKLWFRECPDADGKELMGGQHEVLQFWANTLNNALANGFTLGMSAAAVHVAGVLANTVVDWPAEIQKMMAMMQKQPAAKV